MSERNARLVEALQNILGPTQVLLGEDIAHLEVDWRDDFRGTAVCVARPGSTGEVQAVVRCCVEHDAVIVTQGGHTGLSGGSVPIDGDRPTVIVSTSRMNKILQVDEASSTISVEAGVTIEAIQQAAVEIGRVFGPDWGARGTATAGGGLSTNAGGMNVVRWGSFRSQVLGIEVVLPDGRLWDGMRELRKDASGYDLKQLFIGAEGTLGIVTGAVFALHPGTPEDSTLFAGLTDLDGLLDFFAMGQRHAEGGVAAFELIPHMALDLTARRDPQLASPLTTTSEWYVLSRFVGGGDVQDRAVAFLAEASEAGLIDDAVVAASGPQAERLWMMRDEIPPQSIFEDPHSGIKFDPCVPVGRVVEFWKRVAETVEAQVAGSFPYAFGHVGDGNLHVYVMPPESRLFTKDERAAVTAAVETLIWDMGGSVAAEHGLGQELVDRMASQKPAIELELMRAIKASFDPDNRLNPGKVVVFAGDV